MLAIVGKNDFPLYKLCFSSHSDSKTSYLDEFTIHASLDFVENKMTKEKSMYLKEVDTHQNDFIYCFLTAANVKFLLLLEGKNEDSAKEFFKELYDLYVKTIMNPFYEPNTKINNDDGYTQSKNNLINFPAFDIEVKQLTKKYFPSV